jgi:Lsr2
VARRQVTLLEDDVAGGEASETVRFNLDGVDYEIDLNKKNAKKLRDVLSIYVGHARRVGGRRRVTGRTGADGYSYDPKAVRVWAASNKIDTPPRGRIPARIVEQYRSAGN